MIMYKKTYHKYTCGTGVILYTVISQ